MLFNARDFMAREAQVSVFSFGTASLVQRFKDEGLSVVAGRSPAVTSRSAGVRRMVLSLECRLKGMNASIAAFLLAKVCRGELAEARSMMGKRGIQVLYCNMGAAHDAQFLRAATAIRVKTISHQRREPPIFAGKRILAEANADCSAFVSNSEWTRAQWVRRGLRADRHEVIYNTILPVPTPTGPDLRARLGLPASARLIASVGRLAGEKQFEWGIRAFAAIAAEFSEWHYVIIGGGEQLEHLRQAARKTAAGPRIHFTGELRAAAAYLREVDVLMHPNPDEPFGRVVAEAMLAGKVVVGHASGGVPEMITNGEHGFLFENPTELSEVLRCGVRSSSFESISRKAIEKIKFLCGPRNSERLARVVAGVLTAGSDPVPCSSVRNQGSASPPR